MTDYFKRQLAARRDRRRLASARKAIKRAERSLARRRRVGHQAGHLELYHPALLALMALVLLAIVMV